ncbi:hypothetical protein PsYK624_121770 [Phanerochaete sordida]|uniref:Uncharacterized protein n=1 Tax=Phanerochaete sordida TaxID=48140 RepID=A0A9P3GKK2_9APHY|nr:hypothetical protein PsYK624_121770 [Phanerochaete sordida]
MMRMRISKRRAILPLHHLRARDSDPEGRRQYFAGLCRGGYLAYFVDEHASVLSSTVSTELGSYTEAAGFLGLLEQHVQYYQQLDLHVCNDMEDVRYLKLCSFPAGIAVHVVYTASASLRKDEPGARLWLCELRIGGEPSLCHSPQHRSAVYVQHTRLASVTRYQAPPLAVFS